MLLQAITIDDHAYEVEKASQSFIRTYVFPNGCLPSRGDRPKCVARRTDIATEHLEDFTPHYAETLRRWRANFEAPPRSWTRSATTSVSAASGGMYLSYCEAGFAERRIGVVQVLLAKPGGGPHPRGRRPKRWSLG